MENRILLSPAKILIAELEMQLEAYNRSLQNDEIFEIRKTIALRIVEIERSLVNLAVIPHGNSYFRQAGRKN